MHSFREPILQNRISRQPTSKLAEACELWRNPANGPPVEPAFATPNRVRQAHNLKVIGSNPIPATTFVITHSPSRSNHRDGFGFSEERSGRATELVRLRASVTGSIENDRQAFVLDKASRDATRARSFSS